MYVRTQSLDRQKELTLTETTRNYGIDALRILSMLMVTALHVLEKGRFIDSSILSVNIVSNTIWFFSRVAVNCYIFISGYFLSQKSFRLIRVTSTYVQTWFYSVSTFLFLVLIHGIGFSKGILVKSVLPFVYHNYWFVVYYILLLFISPLLNSAINNMSKNKYRMVLFVLIAVFIVYNNIISVIEPITDLDGFSLSLFLLIYCVAGYIRKFYTPNGKWYKYFLCYVGITIASIALHYILMPLGDFYSRDLLIGYKGIFCFSASICLFLTFLNINIKNKVLRKIVLFVAPLTFAVYLIHESLGFKVYLWELINISTVTVMGPLFAVVAILIFFAIFLICILIEYMRQQIFRVLKINELVKYVSVKIETKIRKIIMQK